MRYVKYWMDVWCNLYIKVQMKVLGNLRLVRDRIVGVRMALLTPTMSIINNLTCQPCVRSLANIGGA